MSEGPHRLQHSWAFWEHRRGGNNNDYSQKMKILGEFNTVEEFWQFKNNIPPPSQVFFTTDTGMKKFADRDVDGFSMFKTGIRPEWEDPLNLHGGEFFSRQMFAPPHLDSSWEKLLMGLVGETIDPDNEICGCRVVDKSKAGRPTYRLELWFKSGEEERETLETIRRNLNECLGTKSLLKEYMKHNQAMTNHGGSGGARKGGSNRYLNKN